MGSTQICALAAGFAKLQSGKPLTPPLTDGRR